MCLLLQLLTEAHCLKLHSTASLKGSQPVHGVVWEGDHVSGQAVGWRSGPCAPFTYLSQVTFPCFASKLKLVWQINLFSRNRHFAAQKLFWFNLQHFNLHSPPLSGAFYLAGQVLPHPASGLPCWHSAHTTQRGPALSQAAFSSHISLPPLHRVVWFQSCYQVPSFTLCVFWACLWWLLRNSSCLTDESFRLCLSFKNSSDQFSVHLHSCVISKDPVLSNKHKITDLSASRLSPAHSFQGCCRTALPKV